MDQVSYKWRIRFITMRYLLIILCYVSFIIAQDFIPQNNVSLSYTQIFFKWPQINNSSLYKLYFDNQESEYESNQNSIVIDTKLLYRLILSPPQAKIVDSFALQKRFFHFDLLVLLSL